MISGLNKVVGDTSDETISRGALDDVVNETAGNVGNITRAANSAVFMPWANVMLPEGIVEGYIPTRPYGTVEKTARLWNYTEELLFQILSMPVRYAKSTASAVANSLSMSKKETVNAVIKSKSAVTKVTSYAISKYNQAVDSFFSTAFDIFESPMMRIASLNFWEKHDRKSKKRAAVRFLHRIGYVVKDEEVYYPTETRIGGKIVDRKEAVVGKLFFDGDDNRAEFLQGHRYKVEGELRKIGYASVFPVDKI